MKSVIWKYTLCIHNIQCVKMPTGAEVLSVHNQNGTLRLWALVDADRELSERWFEVFGTGCPIVSDMGVSRKFVGTVLIEGFVWHVFERLN